jgi:hypothetical protein
LKNESFDSGDEANNPIFLLVNELSDSNSGTQADATEVLSKLFEKIDCVDNIFIKKFVNNFNFTIKEKILNPNIDNIKIPDSEKVQPFIFTPLKVNIGIGEKPEEVNKNTYNLTELIKSNIINNDTKNFSFDFKNQDIITQFPERYKLYKILEDLQKSKSISNLQTSAINYTGSGSGSKLDFTSKLDEIKFDSLTTLTESEYSKFFDGYNTTTTERINTYPDKWSASVIPQDTRLIDTTIVDTLKTKLVELNKNIQTFNSSDGSDSVKVQFMKDNAVLIRTIVMIIGDIQSVIATPLLSDGKAYQAVTEKNIQKVGKYFSCYVNRTYTITGSATAGRYNFKIKIEPKITLDVNNVDTSFTLLGFMTHVHGHYYYVKCDENGNIALEISDSRVSIAKSIDDYSEKITGFIYKQEKSAYLASPGGGGFKPRHNASDSKSRHNSSFKASSSKSKHKIHNRSHTQRVK